VAAAESTPAQVEADTVVLSARGLTKSFGAFTAIDSVDLDVTSGTVHAVIGPNGAGKTTLFNVLTGQLRPTRGEVFFGGEPLEGLAPHQRAHLGMARSFQITSAYPELTVRENVRLAAQAVDRSVRRTVLRPALSFSGPVGVADEVMERTGLTRVADIAADNLSHGLSRRLEIAMALASRPKLLLLDEPLSGMGIDDIAGMEALLRSLAPEHTLLLVEHNMPVTLAVADRVTVLVGGKVLTEGTPRQVADHEQVREAYLGRGHM
jgi:branched-chain amino acid transport system ATP-binding protein